MRPIQLTIVTLALASSMLIAAEPDVRSLPAVPVPSSGVGGTNADDVAIDATGEPSPQVKPAPTGSPRLSLPFSITVKEETIENLPEYMSRRNPNNMDFPYCPIMIDSEFWVMYKNGYNIPVFRYKGTNIENAVRQPNGTASLPKGAYILGGIWYDAGEKKLFAPLHYEVHGLAPSILREIHLASSSDKGLTWRYEGPIITSNDPKTPRKRPAEFSGQNYDGGDGDHLLYVDERGGYFYVFTDHYTWPKAKSSAPPSCAIAWPAAQSPTRWPRGNGGSSTTAPGASRGLAARHLT